MAKDKNRLEFSLSNMRVIKDKIIVADMDFEERVTASGLILPNDDMEQRGIRPRWARVVGVGPEQTEVEVDEWVYVAHGRWSRGIDIINTDDDTPMTLRQVDPLEIYLKAPEPLRDEFVREKLGAGV
jgi:co-chaperonin GroES (HSP10)